MDREKQARTPFVEALKEYIKKDVTPFDVPGHHLGNVDNDFLSFIGKKTYALDINAPLGMDNLATPKGVIKEAEELFADACNADDAFFLINGTSSGVIAMTMASVKAGEKIILPRNVHKSVISALILSGAVPAYVMPVLDEDLEIACQPTLEAYKKAIVRNPAAKAVFVINPTYFGSTTDLKELVIFAHAHNMTVLVDEAHGAHFYFGNDKTPISAMDAGADISSVSFHKTGGSLTQSSVLLHKGERVAKYQIQKALNLINTTSPSTLLLASLDAARKWMVENGEKSIEKTLELSEYAREEINKINGFFAPNKEYFLKLGAKNFDESKLVIRLDSLDITGFDLYRILNLEYKIQIELAEPKTFLCIISLGSKKEHIDALIKALKSISKKHYKKSIIAKRKFQESKPSFMLVRPRVAFHAPGKRIHLEDAEGTISKESVMIYPPGIPLLVPGEVWSKELIRKVAQYQQSGATILSTYPKGYEVIDVEKWRYFDKYKNKLHDYMVNSLDNPSSDGFVVPFEGNKHQATVILLPFRKDTWRKGGVPARKNFKEVIEAIAEHEQVIVGIHPKIYDVCYEEFSSIENVTCWKVKYNDSWARDNMCIMASNGSSLRSVSFKFNAWGGEVDGLYSNWKDDDKLGPTFAKEFHYPIYRIGNFVLEGGSIALDGEGTCIVTEACLLSKGRNPDFKKEEIEEMLSFNLGVNKIIWVPHGIYLDETNEHIDNMVAFIEPGKVVMAWSNDKEDPQYEYCQKTYKALKNAVDAKGRKLIIEKIDVPNPPLYMSKEEAKGIGSGRQGAVKRLSGSRLSASYINFYQGQDFVIFPQFGVEADKKALKKIKELFPNKKIHPIYSREILLGGGNIHCITQQIPEVEK